MYLRTVVSLIRARAGWIACLLLLYAGGLVFEACHLGLTADEPSHLAAAYSYWLGQDILSPPDSPPLTRLTSGWVPLLMRVPDLRKSPNWASGDSYLLGFEILRGDVPNARRLLILTRLTFVIYPLLLVFLVWHWGRQLFDGNTGLLLAACCALEPTLLGHGALIKSDVPAALAALWFAYSAWRYVRAPALRTLLWFSLSLLAAVLTKYSLLPLIVIALPLVLWKGPRLTALVTLPAMVYFGILASAQFQAAPIPPADIERFLTVGLPHWALPALTLLARLPWPAQFIHGLLFISGSLQSDGYTGYLLGRTIHGWVPSYFPIAWAIKFPILLQLLAAAGLTASAIRLWRRQATPADALIWGLCALFVGCACRSNFHIGIRHLSPALPLMILGGGFALQGWLPHHRRLAAALLLLLAVSTLRVYPNGLSYFNEWIGGPEQGWRYLADSNLDWGQNLPELARYIKKNRIQSINTFLWSFDRFSHYADPERIAPMPWPPDNAPPGASYRPAPGLYAVSTNLLAGFLYPAGQNDYLKHFRTQQPIGRAGYSILIYRI